MRKILPYDVILISEDVTYKDTQGRTELALELAKIYFSENFKRYVRSMNSDKKFRTLNTFRNLEIPNDYHLTKGKTITLYTNKTEPKINIPSDTHINLYVFLTTDSYLSELYELYQKNDKKDPESFIDSIFRLTYTTTRVLVNNIIGRFIRALSIMENSNMEREDLNIRQIFDMAFDKRSIINHRGIMFTIDVSFERFLKRVKANGVNYSTLSDDMKEEIAKLFEQAYNDYLNNNYNTEGLIELLYKKGDKDTNIIGKFGKKFVDEHNREIKKVATKDTIGDIEVNKDNTEVEVSNISDNTSTMEDDHISREVFFGKEVRKEVTYKPGKLPMIGSDGKTSGKKVNVRK